MKFRQEKATRSYRVVASFPNLMTGNGQQHRQQCCAVANWLAGRVGENIMMMREHLPCIEWEMREL